MCFVMFLIINIRANEELQNVENLLGMVVHSEELGLVFEKKNSDMQKMVSDRESMCVQKKDFHEMVTIWMIRNSKDYKLGLVVKLVSGLQ